jgi:putative ABC transport system substrate-binding protein
LISSRPDHRISRSTSIACGLSLPLLHHERWVVSYGPVAIDPYQRAAEYVHRILNDEKPADLPVQAATKFELIINLKTAKAMHLTMPPALLARAAEVIE